MDVHVDETGKQRAPVDVDRAVGHRPPRLLDRHEPTVPHCDDDALPRRSARAVEEARAPEDELGGQALHAHRVSNQRENAQNLAGLIIALK
ncbi:MAG: hypothetical protein H0W16_10225 [Actinobacteria bacterium]|nr:hypothetical protein [Actinomycetota bacterium]